MNYLKPVYFELYEWLPKNFYNTHYPYYGENLWWMLFDHKIRYTAQQLRLRYGPMVMNDWHWRSNDNHCNQYRGYRPLSCSVGAKLSQHKVGKALDAKFRKGSVEKIRKDIIANPYHEDFKYITCIEMDVSWLHVDVRPHSKPSNGILKIYP